MLMSTVETPLFSSDVVIAAANRATRAIPPLWPLASSVAVNPFLGQTEEPLATAAARLRRVAGIALTMPRAWYAQRLQAGAIGGEDLEAAYDAAPAALKPGTFAELIDAARKPAEPPQAIPTVAELARDISFLDWPGIVADRMSHWASAYFDQGQALWAGQQSTGTYAAWRAVATHDLTPEIAGLTGFAQRVAEAPVTAEQALIDSVASLDLSEAALESYFHRVLMSLGGWAQLARYQLWQAELEGKTDASVTGLLAIGVFWDATLLRHYRSSLQSEWQKAARAHASPISATLEDGVDAILQEAAERAAQRQLARMFAHVALLPAVKRPTLQMAFCIDVRSEVFRRALESLDPGIMTLGFAGFFGLGIGHRRFGSDTVEARLPVLLTPRIFTCSGAPTPAVERSDATARIASRAKRAWGRFKLAAISSFAFVEAAGPLYITRLLQDGLGLTRGAAPGDPAPRISVPLDVNARVTIAESILRAMSLTEGFAQLVLLAGHVANVVNNPHASALHCGACGGYPGEANARLLASLLNDQDVRVGLAAVGITIPEDTLFLGALHDTTTDAVTIYEDDYPSAAHADALDQAKRWLASAGALTRAERALRLPRAERGDDLTGRASDWAELRPEWALAGCQAFIAAPRSRTAGMNLTGRAFLHDYNWRRDDGFGVLELIITAPVVVASWISLQYYGSTVAPDVFGAGNKLLHNVIGGIGVVEGNGGLLRAGLPWQSVYDGEQLVHDPLRLSVVIDAPHEAIGCILARHPEVRALFDNRWLHLFALDDEGRMAWRYTGDLSWERALGNLPEDGKPQQELA